MDGAFRSFEGFQWDEGNNNKNFIRHQVWNWECEQVFFNQPLLVLDDPGHSSVEKRWAAFGRTDSGRLLVIIFTRRSNLLRVISTRDMERANIMKNLKIKIPDFENEDQEREFWATHSPLEYFDIRKAQKGSFPNLKPSTKSVSIRLPEDMLIELKTLANKKDVPYQSLVKMLLARQIAIERESLSGGPKRSLKDSKAIATGIREASEGNITKIKMDEL